MMFSREQLKILDEALDDLYEKISQEKYEEGIDLSIEAKFVIVKSHADRLGAIVDLKNYAHYGPFDRAG